METVNTGPTSFKLRDFLQHEIVLDRGVIGTLEPPRTQPDPDTPVLKHIRLDPEDFTDTPEDRLKLAWSLFFADKAWYVDKGIEVLNTMFPSYMVMEWYTPAGQFLSGYGEATGALERVRQELRDGFLVLPVAGFKEHLGGDAFPTLKFHGIHFNKESTARRGGTLRNSELRIADLVVFGEQVPLFGRAISGAVGDSFRAQYNGYHGLRGTTADQKLCDTPARVLLETRERLEQEVDMFISQLTGEM